MIRSGPMTTRARRRKCPSPARPPISSSRCIAALVIRLGIAAGIFFPPDSIDFAHVIESTESGVLTTVAAFINVFFSLNLLLFIFNLLPLPPLDGSGIIPLFLSKERAQKYLTIVHSGSFSLIGIMVAWNVFDYIYDPLHLLFINLLFYPIAHYQ